MKYHVGYESALGVPFGTEILNPTDSVPKNSDFGNQECISNSENSEKNRIGIEIVLRIPKIFRKNSETIFSKNIPKVFRNIPKLNFVPHRYEEKE